MDHAVKDSLALFLPAQADLPGQARVAIDIACALANACGLISLPVKRQPYS